MKEEIQLKIIGLIDDGATLESSPKLKALVEASKEATKFYESILVSESMLKSFFGREKAKAIDSKIDALVKEQLAKPQTESKFSFKPAIGFAVAASLAFIALTFINLPSNTAVNNVSDVEESLFAATEYPAELIIVEESEPLIISGSEMETLWSTATEMAKELGVNRYEIMYVMYEGNKDFFVNFDINQPREDKDYFVDLSLIEDLETQFIIDEVKRHIYCRC
tara:strand:- start:13 stop:681 length:669 start_codon:yes stop_codon:yes gene_type:complete